MKTPRNVTITPRRVQVNFPPARTRNTPPRDWADNDPAYTEIFHALSVTFPAGESFFVSSVRRYAARLRAEHPALWEEVLLFEKQESTHTAVHEALNLHVAEEYGHDIEAHGPSSISMRRPRIAEMAIDWAPQAYIIISPLCACVEALEKEVEERLARVQRRLSGLTQLGLTCCLEHFTAVVTVRVRASSRHGSLVLLRTTTVVVVEPHLAMGPS